jgi:hypothetical protein
MATNPVLCGFYGLEQGQVGNSGIRVGGEET